MTLLVRDEEDVVAEHLAYHLDRGVDHVIVTDNLSRDRTPEILARYEAGGRVTVLREERDTYDQAAWVTRMARIAATELDAAWVLHSDADEFWLSDDGAPLPDAFARLRWANVVFVPRDDLLAIRSDEPRFWRRMIYRQRTSRNALGRPLLPKVAHRASPRAVVAPGNHGVSRLGWQRTGDAGLSILHLPLRSAEQYTNKIRVGGRAIANNPEAPAAFGVAMRRQYEELAATGRIAHVDENLVTVERAEALLAEGHVVRDTRLRDALDGIVG